jgi:3'-phosphoadenosine 5'-phosphosulfate sulfotransferase (PAPS reductase)/FAD synthetase
MKYIASWSGGKDSTASIILAHDNNEPLDIIIFSEVMFDKNISGELPEHRDFIYNKAIPTFESWGYKVVVLHSQNTYIDLFYRMVSNSKTESRNGKIRGFPMSMGCYMNSGAKIPPIRGYWKSQIEDVTQYVGIAIDEPLRLDRVVQSKNQVSLLQKYGYTEEMAKQKCLEYDLLSPIYEFTSRGGCWFCPNQKMQELRHLRNNHKDLWNRLNELSKEDTANPYFNAFGKTTVQDLEEQFMWEDRQISLFEFFKS